MFKTYYWSVSLLLLLLNFNTAYASLEDDSNTIFNWAEQQYPQYFSPAGQTTQLWGDWYFRFYPEKGIYLGVNNLSSVHVMGGEFGNSPLFVGMAASFLNIILEGGIINPGNGNCVATVLTPVGMVMKYENLPVEPIDLSVDLSTIFPGLLNQLSAEQLALLQVEMADINSSLAANQLDQLETPKWSRTETVLESTFTRYKWDTVGTSESQVGGITLTESSHQISSADFEIINGMSYAIKSDLTSETVMNVAPINSSYDLTITYTPHSLSGPTYEACEGQSWYSPSVTANKTGTQTLDGVSSAADESFEVGGSTMVVEAVNESMTVPAGTFNTVRYRSTSDYTLASQNYSLLWVSIEYGVEVKAENYSNGQLTSGSLLMSLTQ